MSRIRDIGVISHELEQLHEKCNILLNDLLVQLFFHKVPCASEVIVGMSSAYQGLHAMTQNPMRRQRFRDVFIDNSYMSFMYPGLINIGGFASAVLGHFPGLPPHVEENRRRFNHLVKAIKPRYSAFYLSQNREAFVWEETRIDCDHPSKALHDRLCDRICHRIVLLISGIRGIYLGKPIDPMLRYLPVGKAMSIQRTNPGYHRWLSMRLMKHSRSLWRDFFSTWALELVALDQATGPKENEARESGLRCVQNGAHPGYFIIRSDEQDKARSGYELNERLAKAERRPKRQSSGCCIMM